MQHHSWKEQLHSKLFQHLEFSEGVELNMKYSIKQSKWDTYFFPTSSVGKQWTPQHSHCNFKPHIKNVHLCKLRERGSREMEMQPASKVAHWGQTAFPLDWSQVQISYKMKPQQKAAFLKILVFSSITNTNLKHCSSHTIFLFLKSIPYRLIIGTYLF